jgi:exosortase C (VPDSG-CTERM-specific)
MTKMDLKNHSSDTCEADEALSAARKAGTERTRRFRNFCFFLLALSLLFVWPLLQLFHLAVGSELLSYILLIPLASGYLIYIRRQQLPPESRSAIAWAVLFLAIGSAALMVTFVHPTAFLAVGSNNHLTLTIFVFVCFVAAGGLLSLGKEWMRNLAFAFAFLVFLIPLPDQVVDWLETASQVASADAADMFFTISGTPVLRDGMVFHLPGMIIQVAQECSGIRSSLVLFITSLLVAYLFLKSPWRRFVLVALVIPLGILRNGFRIVVIGLLCVHYGPGMIDSTIHRKGGPAFFVLSLIPLFLLLWWLRRGDSIKAGRERRSSANEPALPQSRGRLLSERSANRAPL